GISYILPDNSDFYWSTKLKVREGFKKQDKNLKSNYDFWYVSIFKEINNPSKLGVIWQSFLHS
ncbi:MAG: hypothetical protein M3Q58_15455, partial [Bacteroidota bacterium]|nr:hypothetical protein [Bacteroidota bacterium]